MKLESTNFTIYEVEDLKEKLLLKLSGKKRIKINLADVEKIDMSAIQLLISLKKSCEDQDKDFEIININENLFKAFNLSGCSSILGV